MAKKQAKKKAKKPIVRCKCVEAIDKELSEKTGFILSQMLHIDFATGRGETCLLLKVEPVVKGLRKRRKVPNVIATFCPFCGKRLVEDELCWITKSCH